MQADEIREFVYKEYIEPARKQSKKIIAIRAGDVHDKMGFSNRMPAVCGALGTNKFENKYHVKCIKKEGPSNGANALFTYDILSD
jgi:5-methylcytosine-specific restriction protein B